MLNLVWRTVNQAASKINVLTVEIDGLTDAESSDRQQAEQRAAGDRQQARSKRICCRQQCGNLLVGKQKRRGP